MSDDDMIRRGDAIKALHKWLAKSHVENEINALPAVAPSVRVKPLVWKRSVSIGEVWEADSIFGEYICGVDNGGISYGGGVPAATEWKDYQSLKDAKAAAQADYEARILAALDVTPAPDVAAV